MYISKEFKFDSAHNLVNYKGKCENLHGHTYRLQVTLKGEPKDDGMIIDFGIMKSIVNTTVIDILDHKYLNDIVHQSTAENLIQWIWEQLDGKFDDNGAILHELSLWETASSFVTLRRDK